MFYLRIHNSHMRCYIDIIYIINCLNEKTIIQKSVLSLFTNFFGQFSKMILKASQNALSKDNYKHVLPVSK